MDIKNDKYYLEIENSEYDTEDNYSIIVTRIKIEKILKNGFSKIKKVKYIKSSEGFTICKEDNKILKVNSNYIFDSKEEAMKTGRILLVDLISKK